MDSDAASPRRDSPLCMLPFTPAMHILLLQLQAEEVVTASYRIEQLRLRPDLQRKRKSVFPRQVAMYLLHVAAGLTLSDISRLYGHDRRSVAHGCARVEDARDDPNLDRLLTILESAFAASVRFRMPASTVRKT